MLKTCEILRSAKSYNFCDLENMKNWKVKAPQVVEIWCEALLNCRLSCMLRCLFHERGSPLVGHLDARDVRGRLGVDPVQGLVLADQGGVHVVGHVANVANHGANLQQQGSQICYLHRIGTAYNSGLRLRGGGGRKRIRPSPNKGGRGRFTWCKHFYLAIWIFHKIRIRIRNTDSRILSISIAGIGVLLLQNVVYIILKIRDNQNPSENFFSKACPITCLLYRRT